MPSRLTRGGTRTVTQTQTLSRQEQQQNMVIKLKHNPGDDGGDDGPDSPEASSPNTSYHQLACEKISRIMFAFVVQKVLKPHTDKTNGVEYHKVHVNNSVYQSFKDYLTPTGEFTNLRPHFFAFKSTAATPIVTLLIVKDAYNPDAVTEKGTYCFVRCDSNRVHVVPFDSVPKDSIAYHRYMCEESITRKGRGRPSVSQKILKEVQQGCTQQKIKDNFYRENNDVGRIVKDLSGCSTVKNPHCKKTVERGCANAEETKNPQAMGAIYSFGKRVSDKNALRSWEEICQSPEPAPTPAPAMTGGLKQKVKKTNKQLGGMPYIIKEVVEIEGTKKKTGYKVCKEDKPDECFSKKPLPKLTANKQRIAIYLSEKASRATA